jgi:predicted transcriptional regulator
VPFSRILKQGEDFSLEQMRPTLGPLESRTLDAVWELGSGNVRQVLAALGDGFAYTTVMTTLDRLYKKGFLEREKVERAFIYRPAITQEKLQMGFASNVIADLLEIAGNGARPVLACIVDAVSESDRQLLDDLERLVRQKKAELEERE